MTTFFSPRLSFEELYGALVTTERKNSWIEEELLCRMMDENTGPLPRHLLHFEFAPSQRGSLVEIYFELLRATLGLEPRISGSFLELKSSSLGALLEEMLALVALSHKIADPILSEAIAKRYELLDCIMDKSGHPFNLLWGDERLFNGEKELFLATRDLFNGRFSEGPLRVCLLKKIMGEASLSKSAPFESKMRAKRWQVGEAEALFMPLCPAGFFELRSNSLGVMVAAFDAKALHEARHLLDPHLLAPDLMAIESGYQTRMPIKLAQDRVGYLSAFVRNEGRIFEIKTHMDRDVSEGALAFLLRGERITVEKTHLRAATLDQFKGETSKVHLESRGLAATLEFGANIPIQITALPGYPHYWGHSFLLTTSLNQKLQNFITLL